MLIRSVVDVDLDSYWSDDDPSIMHRGQWLVSAEDDAAATAVTYFEIDPGKHIGMHTHDAEETIYVLAGTGEIEISGETQHFEPGAIVFVPEGAPHDVRNGPDDTFKALSFFPQAEVVSVFEVPLQPKGSRELGTSA